MRSYTDENARWKYKVVTLKQTLPIKDDLGSCWGDLGIELGLKEAQIYNIKEDYEHNRDRGFAVLGMWRNKKGKNATFALLADALDKIGQTRIADELPTLAGM